MNRRTFIGSVGVLTLAAPSLRAQTIDLRPMINTITKGVEARKARVHFELPVLVDNGNSIPMTVKVESPMSAADHVKTIYLLSERNPVRQMATFHLGPRAGRAEIQSRIRLAGSQHVVALAHMADGSYWYDWASVVVTLSACIDET